MHKALPEYLSTVENYSPRILQQGGVQLTNNLRDLAVWDIGKFSDWTISRGSLYFLIIQAMIEKGNELNKCVKIIFPILKYW